MAEPLDPSWLPSTAAQSTAALVAIVGGFLINRLVTLDAERRQAAQRLAEAEARLTDKRQDLSAAENNYIEYRCVSWLDREKPASRTLRLLREREQVTVHDFGDLDDLPADVPPEKLQAYINDAVACAKSALRSFSEELPEEEDQPSWDKFRKNHGIKPHRWDAFSEAAYLEVSRSKTAAAAKRKREAEEAELRQAGTPFAMGLLASRAMPNPMLKYMSAYAAPVLPDFSYPSVYQTQRRDTLSAKIEDSRQQVKIAEAEVLFAQRASTHAVRQPGVTMTLVTLTMFSLVGIVLPVVSLWTENTSAASMKPAVGVGFLVGVGLFLTFMWGYAFSLGEVMPPGEVWRAIRGFRPRPRRARGDGSPTEERPRPAR